MEQVTNSLNQCHRFASVHFVLRSSFLTETEGRRTVSLWPRIKMIWGSISDTEWWHQFDIFQSQTSSNSRPSIHLASGRQSNPSERGSVKGGNTFRWTVHQSVNYTRVTLSSEDGSDCRKRKRRRNANNILIGFQVVQEFPFLSFYLLFKGIPEKMTN